MKLIVGTESTWSLRAWICSQLAKQKVNIEVIDLSAPNYKAEIYKHSKTGLVPALTHDDVYVHDSLAIMEYLNECSSKAILPALAAQRALARSLCAELHSGFMQIRMCCPFSTQPVQKVTDFSAIETELKRLEAIFESAQLPFMFHEASAVDAFYAILAYRLESYGIQLKGKAGEYQTSLIQWPLLQSAIELAFDWNKKA
ncbi:glutathione S-transferase N-terminal domain-containing protein [Thalassotalea marina]|uniref:Glutathione S-transferase n=1 Tax=Thalassotalea marina TaxID=1673741 RepID=A0A919BKV2_9GAMM|nr:glutathione S-transferase N-terminal domain-containing protein [Thalassotalea marina]GHF95528.1 glutathione S-transferase [Thalassotalea marina]